MTESDCFRVLSWRNHPEIRRYMYSQHEISLSEHQEWFEKSLNNKFKHLLIFEDKGSPAGFVQLTQLRGGPIAEWGFYVDPNAPKGVGRRMGWMGLQYAFEHLKLHKVNGEALAYNEASIRFHNALGFKQEGVLRDQGYDGQYFHDVICFGLLLSEWQQDC